MEDQSLNSKNVNPNHSRGQLAAQGIQILFKSCPSVTDSVTEWELKSERPEIIGGQRGCLHFPRLHLKRLREIANIHAAGSGCPQQSAPKNESTINRSPTPTTPSSSRSAVQPVVQLNCPSRSNMSTTETAKSPLTSPGQSPGSQLPSS